MFHQIRLSDYVKFRDQMVLLLQNTGYKVIVRSDIFSLEVNFGWAKEIVISTNCGQDTREQFVVFSCHPANSKEQGKELFKHSRDWTKKTELLVSNVPYSLDIAYHVKFSTVMGKYDCSLDFVEKDLRSDLYTLENFNNISGRCKRSEWPILEKAFDQCFSTDFHWRNRFHWGENINWFDTFLNSDREQFDIAFGYSASICVPYTQLQHLDAQDPSAVPAFLQAIEKAFSTLIP